MRTKTCDMDQDEQFDKGNFEVIYGTINWINLGMTNGAAWYSLRGTLQDYGYIGRGIMDRVSSTIFWYYHEVHRR